MKPTKGRTRLERESVILWNEAEAMASIWIFSPPIQRLLKRRGWKAQGSDHVGPYWLPKTSITIRANRPKRAISEASISALRRTRQ